MSCVLYKTMWVRNRGGRNRLAYNDDPGVGDSDQEEDEDNLQQQQQQQQHLYGRKQSNPPHRYSDSQAMSVKSD